MNESRKTNAELVSEVEALRVRLLELEEAVAKGKLAEQALRESEEKYRLHFENVSDVVYTIDREFRITDISPSVEAVLGYRPDEIIGRRVNELKLLSPEYYELAASNTMRVLEGKQNPRTEYEFIAKDGTRKIGEASASPLLRDGKIVAAIAITRDITDRKLAEQALHESEEEYRELVQNANSIILRMNPEGEITFFNEYAQDFFGYSEDEIVGKHVIGTITPETDAAGRDLIEMVDTIMRDPEKYARNENENIRRNGERVWIAWANKPVFDDDGRFTGLLSIGTDITERRRAEQALKESEERYRVVIDNSLIGIYMRNEEGIIFANNRLIDMFGYSKDELRQVEFLDIVHPEDRDRARERAMRRMAGQEPSAESEFRLFSKNGDLLWAEFSGESIEYRGKPAVLTHVRDVTERKRMLRELEEREEQYRLLFETVGDVVYMMDREFKIISVSPSVEAFLGYTPEEIAGRRLDELNLLAPEYHEKAFTNSAGIMAGQSVAPSEYEFIGKDGTRKLAEIRSAPLHEGGEVVGIIAVIRDVTEHRRLEEQLLQAQKMESIGTLAGGIAHDFNNILGGILGYASFMKTKGGADHPFFNYIDIIERGAIRASELTAQLLAFARGGKYDTKPVSLNRVVDETLRLISETFDRSIEIETRLNAKLPTVEADEGQMQQALMNLCINAADAMPHGGKLILETAVEPFAQDASRAKAEAAPHVVISVTDTGQGMERETLQRIFEPFFTTKETGKGTGLGLSMVYGVVKNHGGYVRVHSEPGEGSTFKIYLPASDMPEVKEAVADEKPRGGNELILVVDDEEPIRSLAGEILQNFGYRVLTAVNGEEAIEIYTEKGDEIDLVILDMIMPKMGGRDTFIRLKEIDPEVRTILSTGFSLDEKAQEMLDKGMMGYIQKPYQVGAMLSKVRSVLDAEVKS